jgi:hypothetical protein
VDLQLLLFEKKTPELLEPSAVMHMINPTLPCHRNHDKPVIYKSASSGAIARLNILATRNGKQMPTVTKYQ